MKAFSKTILTGVFLCSFFTGEAIADTITVYKTLLPKQFMVVDKKTQRCTLYALEGKESPITYACSSGQVDGDKMVEGDKKTPEGVYFVVDKITEGLDYEEYGTRAFPVNYPNPIDISEGKTGYGIWVHGKGQKFADKITRGCVAFPDKDIIALDSTFVMAYPVIIADTVTVKDDMPSKDYVQANTAVSSWAKAWSEQSTKFFAYYNEKKRSNFSAFKANKQNVFARYPFTYVQAEQVHTVQKGNYFTTWFKQYYYAPNMVSEGIRYLYWQKDAQGKMHIIGEEWKLETSTQTRNTITKAMTPKIEHFVQEWKKAWEKASVQEYTALYSNTAVQGNLQGKNTIARAKEKNWKKNKPKTVQIQNMKSTLTNAGIEVRFTQVYEADGGYKDIGEKTLIISPQSSDIKGWKITKETWKKK